MQDWKAIIKVSEEQGLITSEEAVALHKEHEFLKTAAKKRGGILGLADSIKKRYSPKSLKSRYSMKSFATKTRPGRALKWMGRNPGAIVALAIGAEVGSVITKAMAAPIKSRINYASMKEELKRISPEIVSKNDDEYIRKIYGSVVQLAPIIANNPLVTAVLVRDNIDMPQQQNYSTIQALSQIQKNISDQTVTPGAVKTIATSITGPAIHETTKVLAKQIAGTQG
jgi:hypothetical protein